MKTVNFKFDIDDKVTSSEGEEGIISELCYDGADNSYKVKISFRDRSLVSISFKSFKEKGLLSGWNLFKHEKKK